MFSTRLNPRADSFILKVVRPLTRRCTAARLMSELDKLPGWGNLTGWWRQTVCDVLV